LIICGADEVSNYRLHNITHILSVTCPEAYVVRPTWFTGEHLELYFGDVISESDAAQSKTIAPSLEGVERAMDFMGHAWSVSSSKVLIHCDYGVTRSPALAYVALTNEMGEGSEASALEKVLDIQPSAVPNKLVVLLGDTFLQRDGALLIPLYELYKQVSLEFFHEM
jgi:predicted protein tyrosine phosphatase